MKEDEDAQCPEKAPTTPLVECATILKNGGPLLHIHKPERLDPLTNRPDAALKQVCPMWILHVTQKVYVVRKDFVQTI